MLVEGWLEAARGALRDGGCADVVLVLGAAQVPAPPGVTAVVAPDWDDGLSASVRAGLRKAEEIAGDYAVLHVIDTPDVGAAVVSRWTTCREIIRARARTCATGQMWKASTAPTWPAVRT